MSQPEINTQRAAEKRKGMYIIHKDVLEKSNEALTLSLTDKGEVGEYSIFMDRKDGRFEKIRDFEYKLGNKTEGILSGDVSIHSHPTGIEANGDYFRSDASSGGDINNLFPNFDVNIIVAMEEE